MKAPNGKLSGGGSAQARRHGGIREQLLPNIFCAPKFCYVQKNLF